MRTNSFVKLMSGIALLILGRTLSIPAASAENKAEAPKVSTSAGTQNTAIWFDYEDHCPGFENANCVYIFNGSDVIGQVVALAWNQLYVYDLACDGIGPWGQTWVRYWRTFTDTDGCAGDGSLYSWPTGEGPYQYRVAFAHSYSGIHSMLDR